ncbi:MAG: hypothetical protein II951_03920 [Bacteroidales bacterium]|nr:hypothetical protein [Bacteroidales bacterium]
MEKQVFIDLIEQSMLDSAREVRLSSGRQSSRATLEEAKKQVKMLEEAKEKATGK